MLRILTVTIATLILAGGIFAAYWFWDAETTRPLSVLTWNVQWFPGQKPSSAPEDDERHIQGVAGVLRRADADIVCLQEIKGMPAIETLLELLPEYRLQVISNFKGPQEIAIISKIDATSAYFEQFEEALQTPPRGFSHAVFDFESHRVLDYSVHLKSNAGGNLPLNMQKREESARQILAHHSLAQQFHISDGAKSVSTVVAGDFNTSPFDLDFESEETLNLIEDGKFDWCFEGMPPEETITWLKNERYPDNSFDHIFYQLDGVFGAAETTVTQTDRSVSDHRPILMRLKW